MTLPAIQPQLDPHSFTVGDARWHELRQRSLNDLYWFNDVVLGMGPLIPMRPRTHLLLCRFAERKTGSPLLDDAPYQKIEMPRETAKTTLITQGRTIQRICRQPDISIMLANEKELTARDMLGAMKHQFETNELLRALFPELIPDDLNDTTWSASRIIVKRKSGRKEPTVFVIGVGGTATGMHPDEILVDDAISREAMENARAGSWQIMHQTNRWTHQLEPLLNKNPEYKPQITWIGTRWWHNDCHEHIEEAWSYGETARPVLLRCTLPDGQVQQIQAYRIGDLAVFRRQAIEDGQSIFPEKWSLEKLAKIRTVDPALFAANYMNQPSDDVTATFKSEWLKPLNWLDDDQFYFTDENAKKCVLRVPDLDVLLLVDPGGFGERLVESRARAAAVVVGDDFKGHKFFLDCYSEQDTYLAAAKKIVEWAAKYSPRKIYVERAGQQAAFAQLLRELLKQASLGTVVDDTTIKPESKAKEVRVLEMEPYWQRGQVYVGTGPNFHEFRTQFAQFPQARRVDVLDILGYWPRLMRKHATGNNQPGVRQAQELAAYRARRNWRTA